MFELHEGTNFRVWFYYAVCICRDSVVLARTQSRNGTLGSPWCVALRRERPCIIC